MSVSPQGWSSATLDELYSQSGLATDGDWIESKDQDPDGDVRLIQLADIGDGDFRDRSRRFLTSTRARELNCTYLENGDVLIARMPDPLGRACVFPGVDRPAITAVDVFVWRRGEIGADSHWLKYTLNSPEVRETMAGLAGGTTRQRISGGRVKALKLPVPPLSEQRRIVAKIDSLTAKSARARESLDHIPRLVEKYKQAILAAAFRGDLTESMRVECGWAEWSFERADSVCTKVQSGGTPKAGFIAEAGIPFIKVYNIVNQQVDFEYRSQFISAETHRTESAKSITRPRDVLMNIVGPPLGKVAIVPNRYPEWNINQAITLFRAGARITPEWIYYYLCSGIPIQGIMNETKGSAGQINISLSQCRAFVIPVPSLSEQLEIVRRIETAFAWIDRLAAETTSARKLVDKLDQAILAKAFRGELVPQDPNDEPASVLLDRIRAERAGSPPKKARGRPRKSV